MFLFINPLQKNITLSLIEWSDLKKQIVIPYGDDFQSFPKSLITLIESENIEELWCICGPGAFTRMRIVTLTLNTLHLSKNLKIKWCHFFDIIDNNTPIIEINTTEYLIRDALWSPTLIPQDKIPPWSYSGYLSKNDFTDDKVFIEYKEDYQKISTYFRKIKEQQWLSPIYYKNPHITCSKKNTSPS